MVYLNDGFDLPTRAGQGMGNYGRIIWPAHSM